MGTVCNLRKTQYKLQATNPWEAVAHYASMFMGISIPRQQHLLQQLGTVKLHA